MGRTLRELKAEFLKREDDSHFRTLGDEREGADGVEFLCPVCFEKNGGPVGTHAVICLEPSIPQTTSPTPGRWSMQGAGLDDLTLVAGSSSVFLTKAPCKAHFFVKNGRIE